MELKFKKLSKDAVIPKYQTSGASGFDLHATDKVVIPPNQTRVVSTGLAVELPKNTELQIRPRSGISFRTGLRVCNSPGTVDEDFRGEIGIILRNHNPFNEIIHKGDRIAQGVICPVLRPKIIEVSELNKTERGENRLGSTGV